MPAFGFRLSGERHESENHITFRGTVRRSLAKLGADSREAVPAIIAALAKADRQQTPRINSIIEALGDVTPNDERVRAVSKSYLKHHYETTRNAASQALSKSENSRDKAYQ